MDTRLDRINRRLEPVARLRDWLDRGGYATIVFWGIGALVAYLLLAAVL